MIWSTQYDSVLNKDIKIDGKKDKQNGRGLVHYHARIWETVDIRITPLVLRSNRPAHTAAADFSPQRSLPPHLTNPIFTPVQKTGPFYAEAAPYPAAADPCTEYSVYSSHSVLLGPPTQLRTAVVPLFYGVRSIQQSLLFYAAYSSHSFSTQRTAVTSTQHTAVTLFLRSSRSFPPCRRSSLQDTIFAA